MYQFTQRIEKGEEEKSYKRMMKRVGKVKSDQDISRKINDTHEMIRNT